MYIKIDDRQIFREVMNILEVYPGNDTVIFKMFDSAKPMMYDKGVNTKENFVNQIKAIVGSNNIVVKDLM